MVLHQNYPRFAYCCLSPTNFAMLHAAWTIYNPRFLKTHTTLQTRVGIATGLVVVGDLIVLGRSSGARHCG